MKTAIQIYGLRNYLTENIEDTLNRIKDMGYDGVEWISLRNRSDEELVRLTKKAGLEVFSHHIGIDEVLQANGSYLENMQKLGFKYLPIGSLSEERRAGGALFNETVTALKRFSKLAKEKGLYVMYHNHDFDLNFVKDSDKRQLDMLLESLPADLLGAELDTCWLYSGGVNAEEYITKYADRAPVIHLKDCVKEGGRSGYRSVGAGVLDFEKIISVCDKAEWLCVEQDLPSPGLDEFECARISIDNIKRLLGR